MTTFRTAAHWVGLVPGRLRTYSRTGTSKPDEGPPRALMATGVVAYLSVVCLVLVVSGNSPTIDMLMVAAIPIAIVACGTRGFLVDWLPFLLLLLAYETFRGMASNWDPDIHVHDLTGLEAALFGTPIPTLRLQHWLHVPGGVNFLDVFATGLYTLHVAAAVAVALWLWLTHDRSTYWRFIGALLLVSYAGFVTFALFPVMPPRLASVAANGAMIDIFETTIVHVRAYHPIATAYNLIEPNPYAAMPSLHIAYSTLVYLAVRRVTKSRWAYLVAAFPLAMVFSVVYLGQHYVIDCIAGAAYAYAGMWLVWDAPRQWRWLRQRLGRRRDLEAGTPASG